MEQNLIFSKSIEINSKISVYIPTVREVVEKEEEYYSMIASFTAMPIDMMVQLYDVGINFDEISEFELFMLMFQSLRLQDTSLIFGDLDLSLFEPAINDNNGDMVLVDKHNDIIIDRAIQDQISNALRRIHHFEKNTRKPGNSDARDFMIERARKKQEREKRKKHFSQLEQLIVAMVNNDKFKYNFDTVMELTIYQFNECVRQVVKKESCEHKMNGIYAGTIDAKKLNEDELNWLTHKRN